MSAFEEIKSELAAAFIAGQESLEVKQIEIGGIPVILRPAGMVVEPREDLMEYPQRIRETVHLSDPTSFACYVNRYKGEFSLLRQTTGNGVQAVLDYHAPGEASWCAHVAHLTLRFSPEYSAWLNFVGEGRSQVQLAEFLEDWIHTVASPDGAVLRNMVLKFQALKETTFRQSVNLTSGDVNLTFVEDSETGRENSASFPSELALVMPIFEGGQPEQIDARLRYRIRDGKLSFTVVMLQSDLRMRRAFDEVCEAIHNLTGIMVLR